MQQVKKYGWITAKRKAKNVTFIDIMTVQKQRLQCVLASNDGPLRVGSPVAMAGHIVDSDGYGQPEELKVSSIETPKQQPDDYPLSNLAKQQHSMDYLRSIPHLRHRTEVFGCINRVRDELQYQTHQFLRNQGFVHVNTPILTVNDCEDGSETLQLQDQFFNDKGFLTTSHQLHLEQMISQFTPKLYTISPCFRADIGSAHSRRHLAEFYMCEAEVAFPQDLGDGSSLVNVAQLSAQLIQTMIESTQNMPEVKRLQELLPFIQRHYMPIPNVPLKFETLSYTEAHKLIKSQKPWQQGFNFEDEKLICQKLQGAAIVTDYPRLCKPFYMKSNNDYTVQCFDIMLPSIGEVVGGSVREDDVKKLMANFNRAVPASMKPYIQSKSVGQPLTAGFGVGFDRMVMACTGLDSIKDAIPFGRWRGHID